jgi:hypothetical protein
MITLGRSRVLKMHRKDEWIDEPHVVILITLAIR